MREAILVQTLQPIQSLMPHHGYTSINEARTLSSGREYAGRILPSAPPPAPPPAEPILRETEYDFLKHLAKTPAKIYVLDLVARSPQHQRVLLDYLQRVMISENVATEKLVSALMTMSLGPIITFADKDLGPCLKERDLCTSL